MSTKEKAIAAGSLHATIHSMKRRATWHNYNAEGSYMLTLVTRNRQCLLRKMASRGKNAFSSMRWRPRWPKASSS